MGLTHLGCPSCGGTLSLAEGQRLATCRYCGAQSLAMVPDAVPRYVVALGINREAALTAAQEFLSRPTLGLRPLIKEVSPCYVPFYELTGTRIGTFLLREQGKAAPLPDEEDPGQQLQPLVFTSEGKPGETKEDTRVIQQEFVRIGPGCDLPELGVEQVPLESMRRGASPVPLEPYDLVALQSRATVFAPTRPPARFAEDSQRRIKVRGDRTGIVEQRLKILYYPVWQARYRHLGRPYEVAVDGVTGKVLCARAPLKISKAAAIAIGALALAAFCFGRALRPLFWSILGAGSRGGWVVGGLETLLVMGVAGGLALFLAWVSWQAFRQGGEVLLDEEASRPIMNADWESGSPRGMSAKLAEWLVGSGPREKS